MHISTQVSIKCHPPGTVHVWEDNGSNQIYTAGSDGRIKVWDDLMDDEAMQNFRTEANSINCFASMGDELYCNNEGGLGVVSYNKEDGTFESLVTRFTSRVNHIESNGAQLAISSSDFSIKLLNRAGDVISMAAAHDAPVLSCALSSSDSGYLASASGDKMVKIWKIKTKCCLHSLEILPQCNDISLCKSPVIMSWSQDNTELAVPVGLEVHVYNRSSGERSYRLNNADVEQPVQTCSYSPNSSRLACGTACGRLIVWSHYGSPCVYYISAACITSLCWVNDEELLVASDQGSVTSVKITAAKEIESKPDVDTSEKLNASEIADLFDGSDNDDDVEGNIIEQNELELIQKSERKSRRIEDSDDEPNAADDDAGSESGVRTVEPIPTLADMKPAPTDLEKVNLNTPEPAPEFYQQEAFQSGSTTFPIDNQGSRFMVWNAVAAIRTFLDGADSTIDVEFHDTTLHPNIHLSNSDRFALADVCECAVILASKAGSHSRSCLRCIELSDNLEWSVTLDKGESAECVCVSENFVAVAISTGLVRVFTVSGLQLAPFTLPGRVVTMAAYKTFLLVSFHAAPADDDQHLGVTLLKVIGRKQPLLKCEPLPLTLGSTLDWLGFTQEGTPTVYDSAGLMQFYGVDGPIWSPVLSTRKNLKDKSYQFIVKITERPACVYAVPYKSDNGPRTTPRPNLTVLPFSVPLCGDNVQLEETVIRNQLLTNASHNWLSEYIADTSEYEKEEQTALLKLFSLAVREERPERAFQIASLMNPAYIRLAVQYTAQTQNTELARRIARLDGEREDPVGVYEDFSNHVNPNIRAHEERGRSPVEEEDVLSCLKSRQFSMTPTRAMLRQSGDSHSQGSTAHSPDDEPRIEVRTSFKGILSQDKLSSANESDRPDLTLSASKPNPFKRTQGDSARKSLTQIHSSITESHSKEAAKTPDAPTNKKRQTKLFAKTLSTPPNVPAPDSAETTPNNENKPQTPKRSAFDIYFEENFADAQDQAAAKKEALERFKLLPREEKKIYLDKSKGVHSPNADLGKKRKLEDDSSEVPETKRPVTLKPSSNTLNKLSSFSKQ